MDLIQLTVVRVNGKNLSSPTVYGVDTSDIAEVITNDGTYSKVVVRRIKGIDQQSRFFPKDVYEVSETLSDIRNSSDHLFLCDVVSRERRPVAYQGIFVAERVSGGFTANTSPAGTLFYYSEDGSPNLSQYVVTQTVAQIVAQTAIVIPNAWTLTGNAGTTGANYVGTSDAQDLRISTNSNTRAIFDATTGFMGLNVSPPSYRFDVNSGSNALTAIAQFSNLGVGFRIFANDASPESVITGNPGDLCVVDDGTNGSLYQKASGVATNTGWTLIDTNAADWSLDGNTNGALRYIGTNDNFDLPIRTNAVEWARLYTSGVLGAGDQTNFNLSVGYGSAAMINQENTAFGVNALSNIATGTPTQGIHNTGIGSHALNANTLGSYNTAIGRETLKDNTTGEHNGAFGGHALFKNTTGSFNTACGVNAAYSQTTATGNVAVGEDALRLNISSSYNVAVGFEALYSDINDVGTGQNCAIGVNALRSCRGDYNSGIGAGVLQLLTTGYYNVAHGYQTLKNNGGGDFNTAIGTEAGFTGSGNSNVYLGFRAGYYETGSDKLFIDNQARASEADGRVKALMYGVFGATPSAQSLTVNAATIINGGLSLPFTSTAVNYVVLSTDFTIKGTVDAITITLPAANLSPGRIVAIKNTVNAPSSLTILSAGGNVEGAVSDTVVNSLAGIFNTKWYQSDGTDWWIIA